jgi:NADPH2:quinone reductase
LKAIFSIARGSAKDTLVIHAADKPTPGAGEVLVALKTSGVNPSDSKLRSGAQGPMVAEKIIIHNDGAGVIEAVGSGVDQSRIGQRVWIHSANRNVSGLGQGVIGTAADYVSIDSAKASELPEPASFAAGACLGVPAMTAHRAVMWAGPVAGKTVLVTGGAGAVGHSAIQIAKAGGARVIATVSSDVKAAIATDAGADFVINYKDEDLLARLEDIAGPKGVDHVVDVDFAAHVALYPSILRNDGSVGSYATASNFTPTVPFYPLAFSNIRIQPVFVYSMSDSAKAEAILDINAMLANGSLSPRIAQVFEFEDIISAHESVEGGKLIGNAVIQI